MDRVYRFELLADKHRSAHNAIIQARDLSDNSEVTLCQWTPEGAPPKFTSDDPTALSPSNGVELFSGGGSLYLAACDPRSAAAALREVRAKGIFDGDWPGLVVEPPCRLKSNGNALPAADSSKLNEAVSPPPPWSMWKTIGAILAGFGGVGLVFGIGAFVVSRPPAARHSPVESAARPSTPNPESARNLPAPTPAEPSQQINPAPQMQVATERPVPPAPDTSTGPSQAVRDGVLRTLNKWSTTMLSDDVDGQTDCYAPVVELFFRRRNLDRETLRKMKRSGMETWPHVDSYQLSDIVFETAIENRAVVVFRKYWDSWDAARSKHFAGVEQQRLTFLPFDGEWEIVEEELKIDWVTNN